MRRTVLLFLERDQGWPPVPALPSSLGGMVFGDVLPLADGVDHRLHLGAGRIDCRLRAAAYDDLGRKFLADIAWVGTDAGFRMCLLDRGQWRADLAFAVRASDGERKHRRAGSKRRQHIVDHRLEDLRHAGHDMDIADDEAWRCRDWIGDVHSARGMRAIRWRASVNSISRRRYISASSVIAVSSYSQGTPKALEMASAVMSSCVGPMPPEVKT